MNAQPTSDSLPRNRWAPVLAWSLCALSVAFAVPSLILLALSWGAPMPGYYALVVNPVNSVLVTLTFLTFSTVGALIASRLPENSIGWIICTLGLLVSITGFAGIYAVYSLFAKPGAFPGGEVMAWVENAAYIPMIALIGFLFLLFPTGKLPSRRWRPIAWFGVIGTVLGWASVEFSAGSLADFPSVTNPFGVAGASSVLSALGIFGLLLLGIFFLSSLASLLLRFLHAKGEERQQLKWFASAGVVVVVAIAVWSPDTAILSYLAILGLAVAVGIAILKYRLYEIDIIIRRTLIYSILTASLIFVYFLSVILLQRIFALLTGQSQSELVTVLSTLAIAALFIPLRNRIQDVIDRRLYRKKYDSQKVLQKFGEKVRDETDLDKLAGSLIEVVNETMQPTSMTVWLKPTVRGKSEGPNG